MSHHRIAALAATTLLLLPLAAVHAAGQSGKHSEDPLGLAIDGALVAFALPLVEQAAAIAAVWPGFWSEQPRFMLLRDQVTAILVAHSAPDGFTAVSGRGLPAALEGILFRRDEYPPELGPRAFSLRYPVGADSVPALEPMGRSAFGRANFYLHEAFHGFQAARFTSNPEDERRVRMGQHLVDPAQLGDDFRSAVDHEQELLLAALGAAGADRLHMVREYLEARDRRLENRPDAAAVERRMERREGTATYVGCHGAAAALGAPAAAARECIIDELRKPIDEMPAFPEADARLMRWRLYGTGGAITLLLDDLGAEGWKTRVQEGAVLDEVLRAESADARQD